MHLFLIGFRATGKSTVAIELGKQLMLPVIDSDSCIAHAAELTIAEIFEQFGEAGFREMETRQLQHVCELDSAVVSLGGGAVLAESNRDLLKQFGKTVWLQASASTIHERMLADSTHSENRPALTDKTQTDEIETLMREREPVYAACADYAIGTDNLSPIQLAEQIANWWKAVDTN